MNFQNYFTKHVQNCKFIIQNTSLEGFYTKKWGPYLWTVIHLGCGFFQSSEQCSKENTQNMIEVQVSLLSWLRVLMFCAQCRESFSVFWSLVVQPHLKEWKGCGEEFSSRLILLHALVNLKLQKRPFPSLSKTKGNVNDLLQQWNRIAQMEQSQLLWIRFLFHWIFLTTLNLVPVSKWQSVTRLRQEIFLFRMLSQLGDKLLLFPKHCTHIRGFAERWKQVAVPWLQANIHIGWQEASNYGRLGIFLLVCMLLEETDSILFKNLFVSPAQTAQYFENIRVKEQQKKQIK